MVKPRLRVITGGGRSPAPSRRRPRLVVIRGDLQVTPVRRLRPRRRTMECRYFDSSLVPARLQANIKLACWITQRASTLPDSAIPAERVRLGCHASGQVADSVNHLLRASRTRSSSGPRTN